MRQRVAFQAVDDGERADDDFLGDEAEDERDGELAVDADGGEHRRQRIADHAGDIDADAGAARLVGHVEQQHHRHVQLARLQRERQLAIHLRRIQHHQQQIDRVALEETAHHLFVLGKPVQVVNSGQIDQFGDTVAHRQFYGHQVHGDAGPVADAHGRAAQAVEQGGLAGIGHAQQGDTLHCRSGLVGSDGDGWWGDQDAAGLPAPEHDVGAADAHVQQAVEGGLAHHFDAVADAEAECAQALVQALAGFDGQNGGAFG